MSFAASLKRKRRRPPGLSTPSPAETWPVNRREIGGVVMRLLQAAKGSNASTNHLARHGTSVRKRVNFSASGIYLALDP